jgi:hypothetical protein
VQEAGRRRSKARNDGIGHLGGVRSQSIMVPVPQK